MKKTIIEEEIDSFKDEIKSNEIKSKLVKKKFIDELKNGLGEEIKAISNEVVILPQKKISFREKIINFLKRF
jgi:hypothetical protein